MKIRIRKQAGYTTYCVETKKWYQFTWECIDHFTGDAGLKRAIEVAEELANPQILNITRKQS